MGSTDGARARHRFSAAALFGAVGLVAASCGDFAAAPESAVVPDGGDALPDAPSGLPDPPEPPPPCNPDELPGEGVYVSAAFGIAGGLGTSETPFKTITEGLEAAAAKGMTRVIVDEGIYPERLTFTDRHGGIMIVGGWKGAESGWKRDCESGFRARTILESPESVAVSVESSASAPTSGIDSMTITTKAHDAAPPDTSGASSIGVLVRGPASFRLRIVKVVATKGGPGGAASSPAPTTGRLNCNGLDDCSDGVGGGVGQSGGPGVATFSGDGFTPGDGAPGIAGTNGRNGNAGPAVPNPAQCAVQTSGECNTGGGSCNFIGGGVTANRGRCGCGGLGGAGGGPGRGGGASIALLVIGSGTVALENTNLTATGGGDGTRGTSGGDGTLGSNGTTGSPKTCHKGAGPSGPTGANCQCLLTNDSPIPGGAAGGPGGAGGAGGKGGGGAGGPAHAFVIVGTGKVLEDAASVFSVGAGGAGADDAPSGASSKSIVVELPDGG